MPRLARLTIPGIPHHVIQRGNRRQQTFFCPDDYERYIDALSSSCKAYGVEIWSYVIMPNHVHLIAVPKSEQSLSRTMAEVAQWYATRINRRYGWNGHLWQDRFRSTPMDEAHLSNVARYIEHNPVRAKMATKPQDYLWSSTRAHLAGVNDKLTNVRPLLDRYGDWELYLSQEVRPQDVAMIQKRTETGRPLGDQEFYNILEKQTGRSLLPKKPGPKITEQGDLPLF